MLRTVRAIACLLVLCGILSQIHGYTEPSDLKTFHEDEAYWIGSTHYFYLGVLRQDWASDEWQLLPARENPSLGKYVMGSWLWFHGHAVRNLDLLGSFYLQFSQTPGAWGTDEAFDKRSQVAERVRPSVAQPFLDGSRRTVDLDPRLLKHSRELMLLLAMVSTIAIFFIGERTGSALAGLFAAYLFATHPVTVQAYRLAMIDTVAITFAILSMLVLVCRLHPKSTSRTGMIYGVILGSLAIALACGSKMNSLVIVGVYLTLIPICVVQARWKLWQRFTHQIAAIPLLQKYLLSQSSEAPSSTAAGTSSFDRLVPWLIATLAGAAILVFVSNPTLIQTPIDGLIALVREHRLTAEIQDQFLGGKLHTPIERWAVLRNQVLMSPIVSIALYLSIGWHLVLLVRRSDRSSVLLLWWLIALVLLLAWLPFSWSRYTLPWVPPTVLLLGRTVADFVSLLAKRLWMVMQRLTGSKLPASVESNLHSAARMASVNEPLT